MALEVLTSDRTYFVRTDGNDANDGLTDSPGGAFLTWSGGFEKIIDTIDFNGHNVTMQAGGSGVRVFAPASGTTVFPHGRSWQGAGELRLRGDPTTPSNVQLQATNAPTIYFSGLLSGYVRIEGFEISSNGDRGIRNSAQGRVGIGSNKFGTCTSNAFGVEQVGAFIETIGDNEFAGDCNTLIDVDSGRVMLIAGNQTISGNRTFNFTVECRFNGFLYSSVTWNVTGTVTATRFKVVDNSTIRLASGAGGVTHFPGSAPGTVTSGGVYTDTATTLIGTGIPLFSAVNTATNSNVTGDGTVFTVHFDTEIIDRSNNFSGNTFTAPAPGVASFSGTITLTGLTAGSHIVVANLATSNRSYQLINVTANSAIMQFNWSVECADMDGADTAHVTLTVFGGAKTVDVYGAGGTVYTSFMGSLSG
jgi:hypothetical protein